MLGAEIGPIHHDVDARWLMAYAAALGESDPRYYDTQIAAGPAAHPLFAVCYEWPAAVALRDQTIPAELQTRSVHATHHLVIHRPPRAGDHMLTSARVIDVRPRRSGTLVVTRFDTLDATGTPVTTTDYGSVYRGVTFPGAGESPRETEAAGVGEASRANAVLSEEASPAPAAGDVMWSEVVRVPGTLARVYTECARIWNPIHTDLAVARAAGLAAPILHGTATLALAISRVVARDAGGDAASVREVSARFTGMVAMPSRLTVRGRGHAGDVLAFDVVNEDGAPVLTAGRLGLRPRR